MKLVPLYLTYNNETLQDGVGAQILRIVALRGISKYFKVGYVHSGVKDLTVTQLDPAQARNEIDAYIQNLNEIFHFESDAHQVFDEIHEIYDLSRRIFLRQILRSLLLRKVILLRITVPYYVANKYPRAYKSAGRYLPEFGVDKSDAQPKIVIHFRAGADPRHVDTGKTEARFVEIYYFEKVVSKILEKNLQFQFDICLLTDAPPKPFLYSPPADQLYLWEKTGYRIKNGMIEIKALDLGDSGITKIPGFRVVHGGDPIEALKEMATADFLLMSRSTLSFLGALLNQCGLVIYPPRFGSEPLAGWISGEDYVEGFTE
jgi:hypothetical protein